jgi:hypothetical protein
MYNDATGTIDDDERKAKWTAFQEYVYDNMFINCPFVVNEVLWPVSEKIGEITDNAHLSLADAFAYFKHP